jgi:hypothetical protein
LDTFLVEGGVFLINSQIEESSPFLGPFEPFLKSIFDFWDSAPEESKKFSLLVADKIAEVPFSINTINNNINNQSTTISTINQQQYQQSINNNQQQPTTINQQLNNTQHILSFLSLFSPFFWDTQVHDKNSNFLSQVAPLTLALVFRLAHDV